MKAFLKSCVSVFCAIGIAVWVAVSFIARFLYATAYLFILPYIIWMVWTAFRLVHTTPEEHEWGYWDVVLVLGILTSFAMIGFYMASSASKYDQEDADERFERLELRYGDLLAVNKSLLDDLLRAEKEGFISHTLNYGAKPAVPEVPPEMPLDYPVGWGART